VIVKYYVLGQVTPILRATDTVPTATSAKWASYDPSHPQPQPPTDRNGAEQRRYSVGSKAHAVAGAGQSPIMLPGKVRRRTAQPLDQKSRFTFASIFGVYTSGK